MKNGSLEFSHLPRGFRLISDLYDIFSHHKPCSPSFSPVMAATRRMKGPARRWRSPCSWGKAETEGPMQDRINIGALEGLMQRWGHCLETGEGEQTSIKWSFLRNCSRLSSRRLQRKICWEKQTRKSQWGNLIVGHMGPPQRLQEGLVNV